MEFKIKRVLDISLFPKEEYRNPYVRILCSGVEARWTPYGGIESAGFLPDLKPVIFRQLLKKCVVAWSNPASQPTFEISQTYRLLKTVSEDGATFVRILNVDAEGLPGGKWDPWEGLDVKSILTFLNPHETVELVDGCMAVWLTSEKEST